MSSDAITAAAIDKVRELSEKAVATQVTSLAGHGIEKIVVRHGSEHDLHDIPPARRRHTAFDLDDFTAMVLDPKIGTRAQVFHGAKIIALLDGDDRRDTVTLDLAYSQQWATLVDIANVRPSYKPREAIKLLRFHLHGNGSRQVQTVIDGLSKLDFTRNGVGSSSTKHGAESLGKSVEAVVQQADKVPETFLVTIPVYSTPGVRVFTCDVAVGIYLDLDNESVQFVPLADELSRGIETVQDQIGARLRSRLGVEIAVFHGAP